MEEESGERTGQPPPAKKICQDNRWMMMNLNYKIQEQANINIAPNNNKYIQTSIMTLDGDQTIIAIIKVITLYLPYTKKMQMLSVSNICPNNARHINRQLIIYTKCKIMFNCRNKQMKF